MAVTTITNKMATRNWSKTNFGVASLCYGEDNKCITGLNISNTGTFVSEPMSDTSGALPGEYVSNKYTDLSKCLKQTSILEEYQPISFNIDCGVYKGINTSGAAFLQTYLFKADLVYTNTKDLNITLLGNGGLNSEVAVTISLTCTGGRIGTQQIAKAEKTIIVPVSDIANEQIVNTLLSEEISGNLSLNKPTVDNPNLNMTVKDFLQCFISDMYTYYSSGILSSGNRFSINCFISPTASLYSNTKYRPTLHDISINNITAIETDLSIFKPTPSISFIEESYKMSDGKFWFDIYINVYSPKFTNSDGSINTDYINSLQFNITRGTFNTFNKSIAYNFNDSCDVVHIFGIITPNANSTINPQIDIVYSPSGYNTKTLSCLIGSSNATGTIKDTPSFISTIADNYLCITAIDNCTIKFIGADIKYISNSSLIRTDVDIVNDWDTLNNGDVLSITQNNIYYFKADNLIPTSTAGIGSFNITGKCDVSGNIMSMLYGNDTSDSLIGYEYAFYALFGSCDIVNTSKNLLPATTLTSHCYYSMFYYCTSLTTVPELPATTMASSCYASMFRGCTSLTVAPELPATTLANGCYNNMLSDCTSLTTAPELPATTLATSCYFGMFSDCTSLTTAPELPATTLATGCYNRMFYGCTSLTIAPELPATTLATDCYNSMFYRCSSLCYIDAKFLTTPSTNYTTNWVNGVAADGLFIKNHEATWTNVGVDSIPTSWVISYDKAMDQINPNEYFDIPFGIVALNDNIEVSPNLINTKNEIWVLKALDLKSLNISRFTQLDSGIIDLPITLNKGEAVYFIRRPIDLVVANDHSIGSFSITGGNVALIGNCMSLMYDTISYDKSQIIKPAFKNLFANCSAIKLTTKKLLPTTNLDINCYYGMFSNCTNLINTPELPATTLATSCYNSMFSGCSSLTTAPELPATTLADDCYSGMFRDCNSLKAGPSIIPAKRAYPRCCAYMFYNCTNLMVMPKLLADILDERCYEFMFYYCKFANANALPAEVLGVGCYSNMFNCCKQLVSGLEILPAMTLKAECYDHMFSGCDALKRAPLLPATNLVSKCYSHMFGDCDNLNYVHARMLNYPTSNPDLTKNWLYDTASNGTFIANNDATWVPTVRNSDRSGSTVPSGWTIKYENES